MKPRRNFIKKMALGSGVANIDPTFIVNTLANCISSAKEYSELKYQITDNIINNRIFEFPFFFINTEPAEEESQLLFLSIKEFSNRSTWENYNSLLNFLSHNPNSHWNASIYSNLGLEFFLIGRFSKSIEYLQKAWEILMTIQETKIYNIANRIGSELSKMYARLGMENELSNLVNILDLRDLTGSSKVLLSEAKDGLWVMKNEPGKAFKCGVFALGKLLNNVSLNKTVIDLIVNKSSSNNGFSIKQLIEFSNKIGLNLQAARRSRGAKVIVPCLMHLKLNHFGAILESSNDLFKYQDSTFGINYTQLISLETLESETSSYFLVPEGELPFGWVKVSDSEASEIWGKGITTIVDPYRTTQYDEKAYSSSCSKGMANFNVHLLTVNLSIQDSPVGYFPPRGPSIVSKLTYNHREANQPTIINHSNFGPSWNINWITYIEDNPSNNGDVLLIDEEGGALKFSTFNPNTGYYEVEPYSQSRLLKIKSPNKPDKYQLFLADGTQKIFSFIDLSQGSKRKIYLSEIIDNTGINKVELKYKRTASNGTQLIEILDSNRLTTKLEYSNSNALLVTKITDPYGRFAEFIYNTNQQLIKIKDVIGITSSFTYSNGTSFIDSLTTPYGITKFEFSEIKLKDPEFPVDPNKYSLSRSLIITDPNMDKEIIQYAHLLKSEFTISEPDTPDGNVINVFNDNLNYRNVFHWDKKTLKENKVEYKDAKVYHFTHAEQIFGQSTTSGFLESIKYPLENRIWFNYPSQVSPHDRGSINKATKIAKVIEGGLTQAYTFEYNIFGMPTKSIDPIGREVRLDYDQSNPLILNAAYIKQSNGFNKLFEISHDTIFKYLPKRITEPNGAITEFLQYNNNGQVKLMRLSSGLFISFNYDIANLGFLEEIIWGVTNKKTRISYKTINNTKINLVDTIIDEINNVQISFDYDNLDRLVLVKYSDGSREKFEYKNLALIKYTDRTNIGITEYEYDMLGRITKIISPEIGKGNTNRPVNIFEWCACGSLSGYSDPSGNKTSYDYDIQGRLVKIKYLDGTTEELEYETKSGRLRRVKDQNDQYTEFIYNLDDNISRIKYTDINGANLVPHTPEIGLSYDNYINRITKMTDALGTTEYSYHPYSRNGYGNISKIKSIAQGIEINYGYNRIGQLLHMSTGNLLDNTKINDYSWNYDTLGRMIREKNNLGNYTFIYNGWSNRLKEVRYPNLLSVIYDWHNHLIYPMLKSIKYLKEGNILANYELDYYPDSLYIKKWNRQLGLNHSLEDNTYVLDYDQLGRLYSASLQDSIAMPIHSYKYFYDNSNNLLRITDSITNNDKVFLLNNLNQIVEFNQKVLKYDRNGNLIEDESKKYSWDAENKLIRIDYKGVNEYTLFYYDGLRRILKIIDTVNGNIDERKIEYNGYSICLDVNNGVTRKHFQNGITISDSNNPSNITKSYFIKDHLGSKRGRIDSNTGIISNQIDFDPFGEGLSQDNLNFESLDSTFCGYIYHKKSGLYLTPFRVYDPQKCRWLSKDPIGFLGGVNFYSYCLNNPICYTDNLGLQATMSLPPDMPDICKDLFEKMEKRINSQCKSRSGAKGLKQRAAELLQNEHSINQKTHQNEYRNLIIRSKGKVNKGEGGLADLLKDWDKNGCGGKWPLPVGAHSWSVAPIPVAYPRPDEWKSSYPQETDWEEWGQKWQSVALGVAAGAATAALVLVASPVVVAAAAAYGAELAIGGSFAARFAFR